MSPSDRLLTITLYSHHFAVSNLTPRGRGACLAFAKTLVSWKNSNKQGYNQKQMDKVYAASDASRQYFRFHINSLEVFKEYLRDNQVQEEFVELIIEAPIEAVKVDFEIRPTWEDFDYQVPLIQYLIDSPYPSRLLTLQTGRGKGYCSMRAIAALGMRTCAIMQPKYIKKWVDELLEIYFIRHEDILVIQGSAALKTLLILAQEERLDAKVIIISSVTMQQWISDYEDHGDVIFDMGYSCPPQELFGKIGAGIKLVDEVHQQFHLLFKIDLYTHCVASISLSATLFSEDAFVKKMYDIMFPPAQRPVDLGLNKYIDAYNVFYDFKDPTKIKTAEWGSKNYSQKIVHDFITDCSVE